jgi:hypothetical protein
MPTAIIDIVDPEDYYSTGLRALAEPISGEEHDIVVVQTRTMDRAQRRYTRRFKRHQAAKAMSKK